MFEPCKDLTEYFSIFNVYALVSFCDGIFLRLFQTWGTVLLVFTQTPTTPTAYCVFAVLRSPGNIQKKVIYLYNKSGLCCVLKLHVWYMSCWFDINVNGCEITMSHDTIRLFCDVQTPVPTEFWRLPNMPTSEQSLKRLYRIMAMDKRWKSFYRITPPRFNKTFINLSSWHKLMQTIIPILIPTTVW